MVLRLQKEQKGHIKRVCEVTGKNSVMIGAGKKSISELQNRWTPLRKLSEHGLGTINCIYKTGLSLQMASLLLEGRSQNRAECMQRAALSVPNTLCLTYIEI